MAPEITKRRVTMRSTVVAGVNDEGKTLYQDFQAVDFVRPDILDAYVADARTRWQHVEVSDEPDAGPLGYDGPTFIPDSFDHADAGTYFPPTSGSDAEAQLVKAGDAAAIATEGSDNPVRLTDILEG
ncbi:hypothetical protein [Microbacterium sp.]|uniref:hypothetical protein n=1 Tax=Microbacterium sp. TaxID=51671 RepID=UPI003F70032B